MLYNESHMIVIGIKPSIFVSYSINFIICISHRYLQYEYNHVYSMSIIAINTDIIGIIAMILTLYDTDIDWD